MCAGGKPKPQRAPAAEEPAQLQLDDTQRRRKRRAGGNVEGQGRQSLRVDLAFNPGSVSGLRIPTASSGQ